MLVLAPTLSSTQAELQSPASHPLHLAACTGETGGEVVRSSLLWQLQSSSVLLLPLLPLWVLLQLRLSRRS